MPAIVVSYRREDTRQIVGRIVEWLEKEWPGEILVDIDAIPAGKDFRTHVRKLLIGSDVLLAVIGANWFVRDPDGVQVSEWVRLEIEIALENDILIIPVLVDGARMPRPAELPASLQNFSYLNAAELDSGRDFRVHMQRLIHGIRRGFAERQQARQSAIEDEPVETAVPPHAAPAVETVAAPEPAFVPALLPDHDPVDEKPDAPVADVAPRPMPAAVRAAEQRPGRVSPARRPAVMAAVLGLAALIALGALSWWKLDWLIDTVDHAIDRQASAPPPVPQPPKIPDRVGTAPTPQPGAPVAQRVVLYEEDPQNPQGKRWVGSVVWKLDTAPAKPGGDPELAVRADIEIPELKMSATWSFRRNTDATLPASHIIEIMFKTPPDAPSGGVQNVPGVLMKQTEQTRGVPLAGLAVKVTPGYFLIGLSSLETDLQRNLLLLKERSWFDIPVVYNNNRRAILAMEKGAPGEQAFSAAFAAWKQ